MPSVSIRKKPLTEFLRDRRPQGLSIFFALLALCLELMIPTSVYAQNLDSPGTEEIPAGLRDLEPAVTPDPGEANTEAPETLPSPPAPLPRILNEPPAVPSVGRATRPDSPFHQKKHSNRFGPFPKLLDPDWESDDETSTAEQSKRLRREDRDPERAKPPSIAELTSPNAPSLSGNSPSGLDTLAIDSTEPQPERGSGNLRIHLAGAFPQHVVGGLRAEHTLWNRFTVGARSDLDIDFLRSSNNGAFGGFASLKLGRSVTLTADGGAGLSGISSWFGFSGQLGFLIPDFFSDRLDTRIGLRLGSSSGNLGSFDTNASELSYTDLLIGFRAEQEFPADIAIRFDFELGIPQAPENGVFLDAVGAVDRREDAIHLAHAALSRSFTGSEGGFAASRWKVGAGFIPARDFRFQLELGQYLSSLEPTDLAAWWTFTPRFEAELTERAYLLIEGTWAPLITPVNSSSGQPGDFLLGRLGLRLRW